MVQWLRMQVLGMEVPGSNSGKFFPRHFLHTFLYPAVTALLEYLNHVILHLFGFCALHNFVAVTILLFKLSKIADCYDDQPIYTPIFNTRFTL